MDTTDLRGNRDELSHVRETGRALRHARLQRGWSQADVASRLDTDAVTISRWERGVTFPSPYYRQRLCALFEMSADALGLVPPLAPKASTNAPLVDPAALSGSGPITTPAQTPPSAPPVPPVPLGFSRLVLVDPLLPQYPLNTARQTGLIGRDKELQHLRDLLPPDPPHQAPPARVAIAGLPGVGKTTLALYVAHDSAVSASFPDGILWAGLGQHPHLLDILSRWGALLGISRDASASLQSLEDWAQAVRLVLDQRRCLILVDDAWQLNDALACCVGGTQCLHILTTRSPELALQYADRSVTFLQELQPDDGIRLLAALAPEAVVAAPTETQELVQAVGGLPLGLTLLGRYLYQQTYSGQPRRLRATLERLRDRVARLQVAYPLAPADSQSHSRLTRGIPLSLQASIGTSYAALGPQTRTLLQALAFFPPKPNSFSEVAALAVSRCQATTLDALSDAGLLESRGPGRYTLHQTIADYARQQPNRSRKQHLQRFVEFFVQYAAEHPRDLDAITQEQDNIRAALQAASDHHHLVPLFVHGVTAFVPILLLRGAYVLADEYLTRAQQLAQASKLVAELAMIHVQLGRLAEKQGNYARAQTAFDEGLILARELGQMATVSAVLQALGLLAAKRGDPALAEGYYRDSLELATQQGDTDTITMLLRNLGGVAHKRGHLEQAEQYYQESLTLALRHGHPDQATVLLNNLGVVALTRGDYEQAATYLRDGLALAGKLGDQETQIRVLTNLGVIATQRKDDAQAEGYQQEALALARALGHREMIAVLLADLGELAGKRGAYEQAASLLEEALTVARALDHRYLIGYTLAEWGELQLWQQHYEPATVAFTDALAVAREIQGQEVLALALYGLARVAAAQGDFLRAREHGQESRQLFATMNHARTAEVTGWLAQIPQVSEMPPVPPASRKP